MPVQSFCQKQSALEAAPGSAPQTRLLVAGGGKSCEVPLGLALGFSRGTLVTDFTKANGPALFRDKAQKGHALDTPEGRVITSTNGRIDPKIVTISLKEITPGLQVRDPYFSHPVKVHAIIIALRLEIPAPGVIGLRGPI